MVCRICQTDEQARRYEFRELMFGLPETFNYVECRSCGCLQIETIPRDLGPYYPENYHSLAFPVERQFRNPIRNYLRRLRCRAGIGRGNAMGRLLLRRYPNAALASLARLRPTSTARILDVGCGTGYLVCQLFDAGIANVMGVDPFIETSIAHRNGPRILKADLTDITGEWDIIMFHHSLEHVPDPLKALEAVAARLAPSGTCVVRVPTVSSYAWRHYGRNWYQLDPPRHVTLFSRPGLAALAKRAGLELELVVDDSTASQFWASEQCVQAIPLISSRSYGANRRNSTFTPAQIRGFEAKARELNARGEGDQAAFYLKKRKA